MELVGVTISVNYADFLAESLRANRGVFDAFYVVTTEADEETIGVAVDNHAGLLISEKVHANGAHFNKSGLLHDAQKYIHQKHPDAWIVILDADILLPPLFRQSLQIEKLDKTLIYGLERYQYHTKTDFLEQKNCFRFEIDSDVGCAGYFQMYFDKSKYYESWSNTAEGGDFKFAESFVGRAAALEDKALIHLGIPVANWSGRKTARW